MRASLLAGRGEEVQVHLDAGAGFCTSTQVSKPSPVEPSARYQVWTGVTAPTEQVPQAREVSYMERSAMTSPPLEETTVDTS